MVPELHQQLLYTYPAAARKAVQGEANCFQVREVYRSAAKTLDGRRSEGYLDCKSPIIKLRKANPWLFVLVPEQ